MSFGVIRDVSDVLTAWDIPNFWRLSAQRRSLDSPTFSSCGCTWKLTIKKDASENKFFVSLVRLDSNHGFRTVNSGVFIFIKNANGTMNGTMNGTRCILYDSVGRNVFNWNCRQYFSFPHRRPDQVDSHGTLTIDCWFSCTANTSVNVEPRPLEVDTHHNNLMELEDLSSDLKDLLSSGRKYDITINVQGKEFRAHRALLSARSAVFRAMYEHNSSENESGYLTIPDCDPDSFGVFLNYIYTGKVEEISFRTAYHLYGTAEKYDVKRLKSYCLHHLKQNLVEENFCEVMVLADQYGDEVLMSSAQSFFNSNFSSIFQTPEWKAMVRSNPRLVDKFLGEFVPAGYVKT